MLRKAEGISLDVPNPNQKACQVVMGRNDHFPRFLFRPKTKTMHFDTGGS